MATAKTEVPVAYCLSVTKPIARLAPTAPTAAPASCRRRRHPRPRRRRGRRRRRRARTPSGSSTVAPDATSCGLSTSRPWPMAWKDARACAMRTPRASLLSGATASVAARTAARRNSSDTTMQVSTSTSRRHRPSDTCDIQSRLAPAATSCGRLARAASMALTVARSCATRTRPASHSSGRPETTAEAPTRVRSSTRRRMPCQIFCAHAPELTMRARAPDALPALRPR